MEYQDNNFSEKMLEQLWIEIYGSPMPNVFSETEKRYMVRDLWKKARSKRKSEFNFKFYKQFELSELKKQILELNSKYWDFDISRQTKYFIHKDTKTIGVYSFDLFWDGKSPINVKKIELLPERLQQLTDEIIFDLEKHFNGKVLVSGYSKLLAGGIIPPHIDDLVYFQKVHRIQIPIQTNERVKFIIGGECKVFKEGECWEIDNTNLHSVENNGDYDRINLIVDILPIEYVTEYNIEYCGKGVF